jgi:phage baseplate assembly protein W
VTRTDIRYPFGFDTRGRTATAPYVEHVRQMIEQLLLTSPGERVNRPLLGGGLLQLVFAPNTPDRAAALELALTGAVATWLGDVIELRSLQVEALESTLRVRLDYVVLPTSEARSDVVEVALG